MSLSKITTTVGLNSKWISGLCSVYIGTCCFVYDTACLSCTVGTIDVGKARLMFWDLGGQDELQSLWDKVRALFFFSLLLNYSDSKLVLD